ncbi:unnamed protein product [Phaedon cochleariae]|uniref:Uncharacterized protein n=1 Tax=Phaedon cochleariae TaxID=80249 RepID=A0A9N9SBL2_PHACE|nr:unnamed protein product [Phaedon cochleariae]
MLTFVSTGITRGTLLTCTASVPLTRLTAFLESSCDLLTNAAVQLIPDETNQLPQPKPRNTKTPETPSQIVREEEKPVSPVRDDLLDEDVPESYSDKKKFWETVSQQPAHKRMSLQETTLDKEIMPSKRISVHEFSPLPVPKPRTALQSSQSLIEGEETTSKLKTILQTSDSVVESDDHKTVSVKDRAVSFESSASDSSGLVQTDLTRITESDTSLQEEKIMTEYQASFQAPSERTSPKEKLRAEFQKAESIDNTGYISDSEDVEHYISDSEIEDRVPQIRDRMMSVFIPSASSARKSLYERSASLPTEDLYEVSARSIKARKDYYEEQIRKEMIEEQLTSEIEEDPSPERKNLMTSSGDDEHTDADARSIGEEVDEISEDPTKSNDIFKPTKGKEQEEESSRSVRSLARSFEDKVTTEVISEIKTDQSSDKSTEHSSKEEVKSSVKDLAKGYEKQLGNVVAGQRIGQMPSEIKGFVLDKQKIDETKFKEQSPHDIIDFIEVTDLSSMKQDYETHKPDLTHTVEHQSSILSFTQPETHKEIEIDDQQKHLESQRSVSSDRSAETIETRDDSYSTKPDSMEVLVDKSEIEDSEKIADLDQDIEGRSIESLDDEVIPEITVTLSGAQRRISEESDEYAEKSMEIHEDASIPEKTETEEAVKLPQESFQDTVWEVSIESPSGVEFNETVEDIAPKIQKEIMEQFLIREKSEDITESSITQKECITKYNDPEPATTRKEESSSTNTKSPKEEKKDDIVMTEVEVSIEKIPEDSKILTPEKNDSKEVDLSFKHEFMQVMEQQDELSELLEAKLKQQSVDTPSQEHLSTEVSEEHQSSLLTVEKDDDLSSSVKDESDLGSEIHQDHSVSDESERIKSESHNDIEKIILDSLHQQRVDPEEAKKIANSLLEEIEAEILKRESHQVEFSERPVQPMERVRASEFLQRLAESKGLDDREVELVQSVLARRQRGLSRLTRGDTASSMEITDEDLRYSGGELDYSHVLEQQMDQLEAEKINDIHLDYNSFEEQAKRFQDRSGFVDKINEEHSEETESSEDYGSYENAHTKSFKKDVVMRSSDAVKGEKIMTEVREVHFDDNKHITDTVTNADDKLETFVGTTVKEVTHERTDGEEKMKSQVGSIRALTDHLSKTTTEKTALITEDVVMEHVKTQGNGEDSSIISATFESETKTTELNDDTLKETSSRQEKEYDEVNKKQQEINRKESSKIQTRDDGTEVETRVSVDKTHTVTSNKVTHKDRIHEEVKSVSSTVIYDGEDFEKLISQASPESLFITTHEVVRRTSSSESKSSTEAKSPEDTSSSKIDDKVIPKMPDVIFRRGRSDVDTSSSSSNLKPDRKSGVDLEAYSSSGESHYHSFEMDSGKSRPCSSDVEGLVAAGSSEYESALTSQEFSARSHITSTEYQTAVSSISSKGSMKSLDSESSGNLASVETSEHSETLVPSSSDLEDILDSVDQQILDDVEQSTGWTNHAPAIRQSTEVSDSELLSYPGVGESLDVSEEESIDIKALDVQSKMKRSHEMTFQPEPRALVPDSPQGEDKLGTSLDEGSVLSVSVSSTSSAGAQRTVIELSRADSERLDGSMTVSGTSEHLSLDDIENMPRGSRESLITTPVAQNSDISTSIGHIPPDLQVESVTLQTAIIHENGIQSVSTQVTSENQSPVEEVPPLKSEEPKKKGHRRTDSSFTSSMISPTTRAEVERKIHSDLAESDKYTTKLSFKETSYDEKKDVDESEKEESYETEADQGLQRDYREGRYQDTESDNEQDNLDVSRPQSRFSKSDSERPTSTAFSDDRPDSELADLIVKSSDVTEITDPIERPITPEPCEEPKQDTPDLQPEVLACVDELDHEYTSTLTRLHEANIIETTRRSITSFSDIYPTKDVLEKRDSHGKSSSTSSEKSSFEEAEADAAFNMVPHISPAHKIKQICPILEDEDAEKHELETRERAQKEFEEKRAQILRDVSPGFVPDIKITQHMAPLVDDSFTYPDLDLEAKEREPSSTVETPQTPASNSSKSSEETDQGREYILDESVSTIPEEPEAEKVMTESKSEVGTVIETTLKEVPDRETDSPSSDSFEMLEKPDLIDDFVVIEEVGKEAEETDAEGKSVHIGHTIRKKEIHDQEVEHYLAHSAPTPLTKIKYYPDGTSSSEELGFDFEDSPPQADQKNAGVSTKAGIATYGSEYDKELEANRKWIEQQFQGDQAAMMAAGYGYDIDFERGPLEDIKEEDVNDFAASSYGSQRDSGGSLKESYSSTPEYDVLAGRKYFTRSGEHDDVSMSSLQEFENLEKAMSLEMRKFHTGSQDSSSNGSFKARYFTSKSGQGDDVSGSSLKEFEGLEKACIAAHTIEIKVKEEEALLAHIEEGQESLASESESCETMSGTEKKVVTDTDDEEDYEKRMIEIDEIIKQAQTNVERFVDLKEAEKTESLGRGDSVEEVSKVPDLDLDAPLVKTAVKVQWKEGDDVMVTSTDSLDLQQEKPSRHDSTDSLDQKTGGDIMTASTDSIEFQVQKSAKDDNIMTDSIEMRGEEKSYMVSSDSLDLACAGSSGNNIMQSDSIDEDGSRIGIHDNSSSSTGKDFSSSGKEDVEPDHLLSDIIDVTSSTATHATYQYDTDSVFSGSFTSGGSNTMVSSTNSIDQARQATSTVDVAAAVRKVWFDEEISGRTTTDYIDDSKPYVTEIIEPSEEEGFSHTIHRRVELPPEVRKVTFTGTGADDRLQQFIQDFNEGEETQETEEVDEAGNVHIKKVVQRRFIVRNDGSEQPMSGPEIEEYFRQLNQPDIVQGQGVISRTTTEGRGFITKTVTDGQGSKTTITQQFDIPTNQLTRIVPGGDDGATSSTPKESAAPTVKPEGEEGAERDEPGSER